MRRRTLAAFILALLPFVLHGQTVDEIIAKNIQARGGLDKLKAVRTMRVIGDADLGGIQASFTQVFKRPMKSRIDISIQGLTMVQAYDSQSGWQIVPFAGNKDAKPMTGDDLKRFIEDVDFEGPLVDYKQKGNTVELIGKEKLDDKYVYHLKVTLKSGAVRNLYLDADKFINLRMDSKTTVSGTEIEQESTFGDYKQVEGILFPFSVEVRVTGAEVPPQKITMRKVELNVPVDDSIFKMPAAGPAPTAEPK